MKNTHWKAHCNLLMGVAALMLISIAGCGGGGSGRSRTVATPAPTNLPSVDPPPTPAPTPLQTGPTDPTACTPDTYTPNYVRDLLAGINDPNATPGGQQLLHWKAFAIRIYFIPSAENTPARKTLVVDGFNQWVEATNNRVRWVETTDKSIADSVVEFTTVAGAGVVGLTYSGNLPNSSELISWYQDINQPENARSGYMIVGFTGDDLYDMGTAAHEFGHLLGLGGHSSAESDLMFWLGNTSQRLTLPDVNSLKTAYCDNFNQGGARFARKKPITSGIIRHVHR